MTDAIGPGTLKLVSGWSPSRSLDQALRERLERHAGVNDVCRLSAGLYVVHTEAEPADVRTWLQAELLEDESALVLEFERWSSYGPGVDRTWLLRRGH